jgi:hypothetical protein
MLLHQHGRQSFKQNASQIESSARSWLLKYPNAVQSGSRCQQRLPWGTQQYSRTRILEGGNEYTWGSKASSQLTNAISSATTSKATATTDTCSRKELLYQATSADLHAPDQAGSIVFDQACDRLLTYDCAFEDVFSSIFVLLTDGDDSRVELFQHKGSKRSKLL